MDTTNSWNNEPGDETPEVEITETNEIVLESETQELHVAKYNEFVDEPDKADYLLASSCGILTGMLDVFCIPDCSVSSMAKMGKVLANRVVVRVAHLKGCKDKDLKKCIAYLEKQAPIPSDAVTPEFGGGSQHHFRDFAHHASIGGMFFSILTQFTGNSYGTDKNGAFKTVKLDNQRNIGKTFEDKIYNGIVIWGLHLISDMSGSQKTAGEGAGIPGPILSFFKEMATIPWINNIFDEIGDKGFSVNTFLTGLYTGNMLKSSDGQKIRFDLRAEIGITVTTEVQKIPHIINVIVIYAFYFIKRLCTEIARKNIKTIKEISKLEPDHFLPRMNKCIARMITVSSGVFCAIDSAHASIKAIIYSHGNAHGAFTQLLIRLNYRGIGNFVIAIRNDIIINRESNMQLSKPCDIVSTGSEDEGIQFENRIIVTYDADNRRLYDYAFYSAQNAFRSAYKSIRDGQPIYDTLERRLLFTEFAKEKLITKLTSRSERAILGCINKLFMQLLTFYGIEYVAFTKEQTEGLLKYNLPFYRIENGEKIGYLITSEYFPEINPKEIVSKLDIDRLCSVALVEIDYNNDLLNRQRETYEEQFNGLIKYTTAEDFFGFFPADEYRLFREKLDEFNVGLRSIIDLTVTSPKYEQKNQQELYDNLIADLPELSYLCISEWLDRILGGNIIFPQMNRICFYIRQQNDNIWKLTLLFFDEFDDHNMPKNLKFEYLYDDLICVNNGEGDALEAIRSILQLYLNEGSYAYKLKMFSQIIGWTINSVMVIYPTEQNGV